MSEQTIVKPDDYEYITARTEDHEHLSEVLNDAAENCWEPILYSIWSLGTGAGTNIEAGRHFVVLRRDTNYFQKRVDEVREGVRNGDYESDDDRDWAERFLKRAKDDGYDDSSS
ncbi:MAG: hypothetical protein ABI559_12010 [Chloroflexota bacterium]